MYLTKIIRQCVELLLQLGAVVCTLIKIAFSLTLELWNLAEWLMEKLCERFPVMDEFCERVKTSKFADYVKVACIETRWKMQPIVRYCNYVYSSDESVLFGYTDMAYLWSKQIPLVSTELTTIFSYYEYLKSFKQYQLLQIFTKTLWYFRRQIQQFWTLVLETVTVLPIYLHTTGLIHLLCDGGRVHSKAIPLQYAFAQALAGNYTAWYQLSKWQRFFMFFFQCLSFVLQLVAISTGALIIVFKGWMSGQLCRKSLKGLCRLAFYLVINVFNFYFYHEIFENTGKKNPLKEGKSFTLISLHLPNNIQSKDPQVLSSLLNAVKPCVTSISFSAPYAIAPAISSASSSSLLDIVLDCKKLEGMFFYSFVSESKAVISQVISTLHNRMITNVYQRERGEKLREILLSVPTSSLPTSIVDSIIIPYDWSERFADWKIAQDIPAQAEQDKRAQDKFEPECKSANLLGFLLQPGSEVDDSAKQYLAPLASSWHTLVAVSIARFFPNMKLYYLADLSTMVSERPFNATIAMILNVRHFAGNILQANVEPAIFQIDVFAPVRCASRTASSSSTSRTSGAINSSASTDRIIERVSSDSDSDESDNEQVSPMRRVVYRRHKASASLDAIPLYNDASTSRDSDIKVSAVKEYEDGKIDATAVRTSQKNTHSVVQASAAEDCKIYVDTSSVSQEGTTDIMKASASSEECKIRIATASASSEDSKIEIGKSSARRRVPCSTSDDSSDSDSASSSCSRTYIGRYRRPGTQSQLITQRQQETQRQLAQPCLPPMFQSAFDIGVNLGLMSDATETAAVANSGQEESSSGSNLSSVSTIETMIENRMTFVCPTYTAERVLFLQFA